MKQFPDEINQIMNSPEALKLLKNKDALMAISQSPEVQKMMQILTEKSGGNLQSAAEAAMQGDPSKLSRLVSEATKNPEVAKTMSNLNKNFPK